MGPKIVRQFFGPLSTVAHLMLEHVRSPVDLTDAQRLSSLCLDVLQDLGGNLAGQLLCDSVPPGGLGECCNLIEERSRHLHPATAVQVRSDDPPRSVCVRHPSPRTPDHWRCRWAVEEMNRTTRLLVSLIS